MTETITIDRSVEVLAEELGKSGVMETPARLKALEDLFTEDRSVMILAEELGDSGVMETPARITQLEREVADLRQRLAALENREPKLDASGLGQEIAKALTRLPAPEPPKQKVIRIRPDPDNTGGFIREEVP
jgi:hypothetical protein